MHKYKERYARSMGWDIDICNQRSCMLSLYRLTTSYHDPG